MSDVDDGKFMKQIVSVEYDMKPSPEQVAYGKELARHRIVGQRCPECGLTDVPGSGYCPICAVPIGGDGHVGPAFWAAVHGYAPWEVGQWDGQVEQGWARTARGPYVG